MTMGFILVQAGVESLLEAYASTGGYRVAGYNNASISADDILGTRKLVQVYSGSGRLSGSFGGPATHDPILSIDLMVSAKAQVDLSVVNDEESTAVERAAAMAASINASKTAETEMNLFIQTIFGVLTNNENINLGVDEEVAIVANRWIPEWKKSKPMEHGDLVVLHATLDLHYRVNEDFDGLALDTAGTAIKTTFELTTDEDTEPDEGLAASEVGG